MSKSRDAFRTISEVADWMDTPAHVLRFWESKFSQIKPVKRAGGRRYYRPADMRLLGGLKRLLHEEGMTIKGAQQLLREKGVKHVAALSRPLESDEPVVEATALPAAEPAAEPAPDAITGFGLPPAFLRNAGAVVEEEPEPAQELTREIDPTFAEVAETDASVEDAVEVSEPEAADGPLFRHAAPAPSTPAPEPEPVGVPRLAALRAALKNPGALDKGLLADLSGRLLDLRLEMAQGASN